MPMGGFGDNSGPGGDSFGGGNDGGDNGGGGNDDGMTGYGGFGDLGIGNPGSYGGQQSVGAPGHDGGYADGYGGNLGNADNPTGWEAQINDPNNPANYGFDEESFASDVAAIAGKPTTREAVTNFAKAMLSLIADPLSPQAVANYKSVYSNVKDYNAYFNALSPAEQKSLSDAMAEAEANNPDLSGGDGGGQTNFGDVTRDIARKTEVASGWGTDVEREKYERFENYYKPIETDLMAGLFDPTKREEQATEAAGISRQQFDNSFRALQQNNARYGQPSADVMDFQKRRMEIESALGSTQAANDVRSMAFDRDLTTGQGLSAMARGLSGQVTNVDGQLSNMALQRQALGEQAANQAAQQRAQTIGTAAGLASAALNYYAKS